MTFDKVDFTFVKGGEYQVGLDPKIISKVLKSKTFPLNEEFLWNSFPAHKVFIPDFFISKKLITHSAFKKFIQESGYITDAENEGWGWIWKDRWTKAQGVNWNFPDLSIENSNLYLKHSDLLPVLQVSWNDAKSYCHWASSFYKLDIDLPKEDEWEIFAKNIGIPSLEDFEKIENKEIAVPYFDKLIYEVKKNKKELTGILWEWTDNWFDKYLGGHQNKEFGEVYKVLRGGSLLSNKFQNSSQYRFRRCPTARSLFYGFRIKVESF